MGARLSGGDVRETALGDVESWPSTLRTATALLLQSGFPMFLVWGAERTLVYNDAYRAILGDKHPEALGRSFWDVWPEVRRSIEPVIEAAFAGEASFFEDLEVDLVRGGSREPAWFTFSYSPVRDDAGVIAGALCVCVETTRTVHERKERERREQRLGFLDRLARETSGLSDAQEILAATTRMLGQELGVTVCAYADMDAEGDSFTTRGDWSAPGCQSIVGRYRLSDFGQRVASDLLEGRPLIINNNLEELPPEDAEPFQRVGITATLCMPLVKDGRLRAQMAVHDKVPHVWTEAELALVREVTERSWAHVERAGVEAGLRAREEQLRSITDAVPVLISYVDAEHRYGFVNQAYETWFGRSRAEIQGRPLREVLGDQAYQAVRPRLEEAFAGRRLSFESRMNYRSAGQKVVRAEYVPDYGADGRVLGVYAVVADITERVAAEDALRQSEERFRKFSESTREGVVIHDTVTVLDCNPAYARLLGFDAPEDLIGRRALEFVDPKDLEGLRARHRSRNEEPYLMTLRRRDGSRFVAECVGREGEWQGRPVRIGLARDLSDQRAAEEALLESENRLRLATDFAEVGLWDVDEVNQTLFWPARVKAMFGVSPDAPVTMADFYAGLHPDDREATAAAYAAAADPETRAAYDVEYRTIGREDGVLRWVAAKGRGVFDEDGRCIRVIGTAVDITERREMERRLREEAERVQLALDAGAILGTWVWDVPNDRFTADERFAHAFGLDPELCRAGLRMEQVAASIHPEDEARVAAAMEEAVERGGAYRCQYRVRQRAAYRWVEASGQVELTPSGKPMRFPGVLIDIEERRAMQAERDQALELLRTFIEAVPGVVYAKDRAGRMLVANRGASELIGKPPAEYIGRTDAEFLDDPEQGAAILATDRRIMETGVPEQAEEPITLPDGTLSYWHSTKAPLRDGSGEIIGLVGSSVDITARKHAEEARDLLMREVDHRARNALTVIQTVVRLTDASDPAVFREAVIGRIDAMARAQAALAKSNWLGSSIAQVVGDELLSAAPPERLNLSGPEVAVSADQVQPLSMILHELATNATKYGALSSPAGRLDVSWGSSADGWRLDWREHGGPAVRAPTRRGFGSRLIKGLADQLNCDLETLWLPEGLAVSLKPRPAQARFDAAQKHRVA